MYCATRVFVGYCEDSKGYRLFDIEDKGKIIKARDVVFLENKFSIEERSEADNNLNSYIYLSNEDKEVLSSEEDIQQNDIRSERRSEEDEEEFQSLTDQEQQDAEEDNRETENRHQDHKDQDQEDQDNDKNQDREVQDNVGEDIRETERRYPKRNRKVARSFPIISCFKQPVSQLILRILLKF
ncbi:glutamic acid-rich protein-like [Solenopsis invicta]|uniref:glutamic acid-rich protein-like n=1 Tax=Solenopsis invicta TaxID=13686 RepID=UPI00193D1562|nr:glutamic acid-rich protein-like [Solenopsis invicta]